MDFSGDVAQKIHVALPKRLRYPSEIAGQSLLVKILR